MGARAGAGPGDRLSAPGAALRLPQRHFNVLDLTRLIAATLVLFWHYQHFFVPPGHYHDHVNRPATEPLHALFAWAYDHGAVAVPYFWAVSGFVFAQVYLADPHARARFWPARLARLWPLHLLTLALVAALQADVHARWGGYFIYRWNDARHLLLNLGFAQFWGWQADQSFNGPAWSLSTEILAYAAFWLLLPALRRAAGPVALTLALALALLAIHRGHDAEVAECVGYFFGGVSVHALARASGARRSAAMLALAGAGALLAAALPAARWHGLPATASAIFATLALALLADFADAAGRFRAGQRLGDASYGVYLWHFPLQLALVLAVPGVAAAARQGWFLALFLALTFAAGFASHRWIERPAQRAVLRAFGTFRPGAAARSSG